MLNKEQKNFLRTLTHGLNPIIRIGQHGLTDKVMAEINIALDHHELIKIKIRVCDRELRDKTAADICIQTSAETMQKIGNIIVIYKQNKKEAKINLPK